MAFADAYLTGGQVRYLRRRMTELERRHGRVPAAVPRVRHDPAGVVRAPVIPEGADRAFPTKDQLLRNRNAKRLGQGAYGQVWLDPGPPPRAVKYGDVKESEYEHGKVLGNELGVGPAVYKYEGRPQGNRFFRGSDKLAMEYLEGQTIGDEYANKPLDRERAQASADVIQHAMKMYRAGYAHNDLHMGNVMRLPDGSLKIIDYGMVSKGYRHAIHEILYGRLNIGWLTSAANRASDRALYDDLRVAMAKSRDEYENHPGAPAGSRGSLDDDDQYFKDLVDRLDKDIGEIFRKNGYDYAAA